MIVIANVMTVLFGLLVVGLFLLVRLPRCFVVLGTLVALVSSFILCLLMDGWHEAFVFLIGAEMLVVGLGFVRVMLVRSVSLNALIAISEHAATSSGIQAVLSSQMTQEIESRCLDLRHRGLACRQREALVLTRLGRFIAGIVWLLTRSLRLTR